LIDKQIAAIAIQYGMTVATRNTIHFADTGVPLFNPFLPSPSGEMPLP
jgi:predicted nucleic acid-binding protein